MALIKTNDGFHIKKTNIKVSKYNTNYFDTARCVVIAHSATLTDFANSEFSDFIEFLQDEVDNNSYLMNSLKKESFDIIEDGSVISTNNDGDFMLMGVYHIGGAYTIFMSGSYSFVQNNIDNSKYIYYGN